MYDSLGHFAWKWMVASESVAGNLLPCPFSTSCTYKLQRFKGKLQRFKDFCRTNYNVLRTFAVKPRPESGLDWLICAAFARQRESERVAGNLLPCPFSTSCTYRGTSLIRNFNLPRTTIGP